MTSQTFVARAREVSLDVEALTRPEAHEGNIDFVESVLDQAVAFLAISAIVGLVVQFDREDGLAGREINDNEIE